MPVAGSSGCLIRLLTLLILVPLAELVLLLLVAHYTSIWTALLTIIVTGVAGSLLIRTQGWRTLRKISDDLRQGRLPTDALLDAALIICAGALLLTPGVLTDILAIALLIPFTRNMVRRRAAQWIRTRMHVQSWVGTQHSPGSQIIDAYVVDRPEKDPSQDN